MQKSELSGEWVRKQVEAQAILGHGQLLQLTAEQSHAARTSLLLPPPSQKQDRKTHFKAKRYHGGSCQKERVEDEAVGEVDCLSPYKVGSKSMLIWS